MAAHRLFSPLVRRLLAVFCLGGALAALLAPALWNGHALIFYDTAGYVEAVRDMRLVPGRSLFYGLFLWGSSLGWWSFWPTVLMQTVATLWLIQLVLRSHHLPHGPMPLALAAVILAGLTGIGWYTSQLMPDIMVPQTVLALWLLGFHWPELRPYERVGLALLTILGLLAHMSCLALALGLVVLTLAASRLDRHLKIRVFWAPPLLVVLAALLLMPPVHFALTGQFGYTPGGPNFLFGRLVQDGLASRWLAEHCPQPGIRLCDLQHRLPATADDFLWTGQSPFQDLGGWQNGAEAELKPLTLAIVRSYPGMTLWTTVRSTAQQMVAVASGDDLHKDHSDARGYLGTFLPVIAAPFASSRQYHLQVGKDLFDRLNRVHIPVALLAVSGLVPAAFWCRRRGRHDLAAFGLFIFLALLGNAFICGALSNPHDRYQSRLVWLAPLVIGMITAICWHNNPASAKKINQIIIKS